MKATLRMYSSIERPTQSTTLVYNQLKTTSRIAEQVAFLLAAPPVLLDT